MGRKRSRSIQSVESKFPDIGKSIEAFVSDRNVGADAWRRSGVLTFDGNIRVNEKVTYGWIQEYLQEMYSHKFSYGTVMQLCIARNKRRRSIANYKGLAKVTTRRARKGFEIKYNPDRHWSSALYHGLNFVECTDGSNIININRDDASGFRLDTLTTHCKHATPAVTGEGLLTTHTDYVNRHPSVLQTTSYREAILEEQPEMTMDADRQAELASPTGGNCRHEGNVNNQQRPGDFHLRTQQILRQRSKLRKMGQDPAGWAGGLYDSGTVGDPHNQLPPLRVDAQGPPESTQDGRVAGTVPRRSSRGRLAAAGGNVTPGICYLELN